jgi:hypothetical protein
MKPQSINPAKLARAQKLVARVKRAKAPMTYLVPMSRGGFRRVNLDPAATKVPCGCPSQVFNHNELCKHALAALIYRLTVELNPQHEMAV